MPCLCHWSSSGLQTWKITRRRIHFRPPNPASHGSPMQTEQSMPENPRCVSLLLHTHTSLVSLVLTRPDPRFSASPTGAYFQDLQPRAQASAMRTARSRLLCLTNAHNCSQQGVARMGTHNLFLEPKDYAKTRGSGGSQEGRGSVRRVH